DFPGIDLVKTIQQIDDGGFSGTGGPYNGNRLPGLCRKGNPMEHLFPRDVAKADIPEFQISLHIVPDKAALIRDMAVRIQDLEYPVGGHHSQLQGIELVCNLPKGAEEKVHQEEECDNGPLTVHS